MLGHELATALSEARPITHSLNPTCTGTSVIALSYDNGVAIVTDTKVSYGSSARYFHHERQIVLNKHCLIAYSGDCADFQWIHTTIHSEQEDFRRRMGDPNAYLKPKMVHNFLTSYLYYRRSKMDPLWNTLVIVGLEPVEFRAGEFKPFIGVIQKHGTAYEVPSVATGLASMMLNQVIETELGGDSKNMSREQALNILRKAMEITYYRDCYAENEYSLSFIEKGESSFLTTEKLVGRWDIAEKDNQYF